MSCEGDSLETGDYLTTAEAARRMGVGKAEVREMCRGGDLPGSYQAYPRAPWRIPREVVEAWLREHAQGRKSGETSGPPRWWDWFRYSPFVFYPSAIAGALATLVAILAIVSVVADIGGARQQFKEWDPFRKAFQHARDDEVLVIIATFDCAGGPYETRPHGEIKLAIDQAAAEVGFDQLRAEVHPTQLQAGDRKAAEKLGQAYNASIVIWGTETSARWQVNYLNLRPDAFGPVEVRIGEGAPTQLDSPDAYKEFVTIKMPGQFTFYALTTLAEAYSVFGAYEQAINAAERALVSFSADPGLQGLETVYFLLGWTYQNIHWNAQSIRHYTEAIRLKPDYVEAYLNRGSAYRAQGNYERAIADCDQAIRVEPNSAVAYTGRAMVYQDQSEYERAIADYDEAIRLRPDLAWIYSSRSTVYLTQGNYERAIADCNKAIRLEPGCASAYFNRGSAYLSQDDYKRAIADYDKAVRLEPDSAWAYIARGNAYLSQGSYRRAIADCDQAIHLEPYLADAYYIRGCAYRAKGDYERAIADYTEVTRLKPNYGEAYYDRGLTYTLRRERDRAAADLQRALELADSEELREDVQRELDTIRGEGEDGP